MGLKELEQARREADLTLLMGPGWRCTRAPLVALSTHTLPLHQAAIRPAARTAMQWAWAAWGAATAAVLLSAVGLGYENTVWGNFRPFTQRPSEVGWGGVGCGAHVREAS